MPFQIALLDPLIGSVFVESRSEKVEHSFHVTLDDLVLPCLILENIDANKVRFNGKKVRLIWMLVEAKAISFERATSRSSRWHTVQGSLEKCGVLLGSLSGH